MSNDLNIASLDESEVRFREVADAAPVLMWISDCSKTCVWFNRPWLEFTGRSMAQELGDGWMDGVHADDRTRCIDIYEAAFDRQEPYRTEYRRRRADGAWRILDATGIPRFNDGRFMGYIGSCVDITEQRIVVQTLSDREEQLRLATEAAEIGLWDRDLRTDVLTWDPRLKAMFGIDAAAPVSMLDYYRGLHPDDKERAAAAYAAAVDPARRALYDVEYRAVGRNDGVVRWVAAKGRGLFENDTCVRVIGAAIDITHRKAAEHALRDLNETLEQRVEQTLAERNVFVDIVESTDARVLVLDLGFRILALNRAMAAELNTVYGVNLRVGDNLLDSFDAQSAQRRQIEEVWGRALSGEEFTVIGEFGDPGHERRHYEIKFNALRDRHGALIGAFQFVYDVTARLRDQARIAETETHLRQTQKMEAIGQLTGGVAHDFNNLLMVISGGLSLLERPGDAQRRQRVIDGMRQAAERGASLSRQLLAFSRRQALKPEPVDLRRQIHGMRELLDRTLRVDVAIKTELAADLWPIKVDPAELELVFLNLCVNSRDAMPNGGVITIRAGNRPNVQGEASGDFVAVEIVDTGAGMSKDVLARVFEPFFTTKEIGKGSGLGLPQVYGFAQQSGGLVRLSSTEGRGTTVTLLLPRSDVAPAPEERPAAALDANARRRAALGSILLVEDDNEVAALVEDMLQELGYRVTRAASAQGALGALADDRPIDLVFSDIMMPGSMNGIDLALEIKRRRAGLPVLLTSGYAGSALTRAEAANIRVLRKPYQLQALDGAIRTALRSAPPAPSQHP